MYICQCIFPCILTMYIYQYTALTAALAALTAHRHRPHGVFFSVLRADWTQFFSGACAPTRAIAELIKSVGYTSMVDFDTGGEPHAPERLSHWAPVACPLCGKTVGLQPTSNLSSMISYKRPRKLDVLPVPHYHTYSHSSTHDRPTVRGLTRWPRDRWTTRHINKEHKRERHRVRYCVAAPSGGRTLQASRRNQDAGRGLRQRTAKSVATQAVHTPHAAHRLRVRGRVAPYVAS